MTASPSSSVKTRVKRWNLSSCVMATLFGLLALWGIGNLGLSWITYRFGHCVYAIATRSVSHYAMKQKPPVHFRFQTSRGSIDDWDWQESPIEVRSGQKLHVHYLQLGKWHHAILMERRFLFQKVFLSSLAILIGGGLWFILAFGPVPDPEKAK
jgi:hypothetical protein